MVQESQSIVILYFMGLYRADTACFGILQGNVAHNN